jgi:hypothetical protein
MAANALGGRIAIVVNGLDFTVALTDNSVISATSPTVGSPGLILVTASLVLVQTLACPEVLDPRINTARWQIGLPVYVYVADETGNNQLVHTLRIRTRPVYDEDALTLTLDCADTLGILNTKTPPNELTSIDPTVGMSRTNVIGLLLAGDGGTLPGSWIGSVPGTLYWPPSKYGTSSFVSQAGEIAFSSPDGPYWLYCDPSGNIRSASYGQVVSALGFSIYPSDIIDTQLLNGDEYTKPVRRIKATGTSLRVVDQTFNDRAVSETFLPYSDFVGGTNTTPVLARGEYVTQSINGDTFYKKTIVKQASSTQVATVGANAGIKSVYSIKTTEITEESKVYNDTYTKDSNGDYTTTAGYILSSKKIESKLRGLTPTRVGNTVTLTEEMYEWQRTRETFSYDSDGKMTTYVKAVDQKLGDIYATIVPPIGTSDGLIPAVYSGGTGSNSAAWVPVTEVTTTWTASSEDENYDQKVVNKIASGLAGGTSRYLLVDNGTTKTKVSAPNEPDRKPLGYTTTETAINAYATFKAPGSNNSYDDKREEAITFADNKTTLALLANWIAQHDYGISQGRNFITPIIDRALAVLIEPLPFKVCYWVDPQGGIYAYLFQGYSIHCNATESVIEFDAPLLKTLVPTTPTVTANTITTGVTIIGQVNQPVIFYGVDADALGVEAGRTYYATPNGSGGFTISLTPGGAAIPLNGGGHPTVTVVSPPIGTPPYVIEPDLIGTTQWTGRIAPDPSATYPPMVGTTRWVTLMPASSINMVGVTQWTAYLGDLVTRRIYSFSPTTGSAGTIITVSGVGFTGATGLSIGGIPATGFAVLSDLQAQAIVGSGAASGLVQIAFAGGSLISDQPFVVPFSGSTSPGREVLPSNRDYYVRTADGSDSNNGLVNSPAGAFATVQKAIDTVSNTVDIAGRVCRILVTGNSTPFELKALVGGGIEIVGDVSAPANCTVTTTTSGISALKASFVSGYKISGMRFKFSTAVTGFTYCVNLSDSSVIFNACEFEGYPGSYNDNIHIGVGLCKIQFIGGVTFIGGSYCLILNTLSDVTIDGLVTLSGLSYGFGALLGAHGGRFEVRGATWASTVGGNFYNLQALSSIRYQTSFPPPNTSGVLSGNSVFVSG